MITVTSIGETRRWADECRKKGLKTGLVPTMGALHEGHIRLVERSVRENGSTGCSIFVNPIQFNNPEDLEKYPRTLESDREMLQQAGCDLLFAPSVAGMYPEGVPVEKYDFGDLERVMEGAFRPGHFNGVAVVVKRLFDIFTPDRAYFGEKDFQQLRIIQELAKQKDLEVEIVPCPTVREPDGLAMSSRNRRLSPSEREAAPELYATLLWVRENAGRLLPRELEMAGEDRLRRLGFRPEYLRIALPSTLQPVLSWQNVSEARVFVAAHLGNVRLIDNLEIIP